MAVGEEEGPLDVDEVELMLGAVVDAAGAETVVVAWALHGSLSLHFSRSPKRAASHLECPTRLPPTPPPTAAPTTIAVTTAIRRPNANGLRPPKILRRGFLL